MRFLLVLAVIEPICVFFWEICSNPFLAFVFFSKEWKNMQKGYRIIGRIHALWSVVLMNIAK
jgi:hypothetical protein